MVSYYWDSRIMNLAVLKEIREGWVVGIATILELQQTSVRQVFNQGTFALLQ